MPGPGYKYDKASDGDSQGSEKGGNGAAEEAPEGEATAVAALSGGVIGSPVASPAKEPAAHVVRGIVAIDVACVLLALLPFFVLETNMVSPFQRGFFCSDQSISYPNRAETVSDGYLVVGGFLIVLVTVVGGELCSIYFLGRRCPPVTKRAAATAATATAIRCTAYSGGHRESPPEPAASE